MDCAQNLGSIERSDAIEGSRGWMELMQKESLVCSRFREGVFWIYDGDLSIRFLAKLTSVSCGIDIYHCEYKC